MIAIVTTRAGRHTVFDYLAGVGHRDRDRLRGMTYAQLESGFRRDRLPAGVYVFADLERLSTNEKTRARSISDRMRDQPSRFRLLNRPHETLTRLSLLRRLHARGWNDFRAWAVTETIPQDVRFPVFVRRADDHMGPQGGLIATHDELTATLSRLRSLPSGGEGWICCERVDTRDSDGLHRKYAAFMVGDRVIPRHLLFSHHWVVKRPDLLEPQLLDEEQSYLATNPHQEPIRSVFSLAATDYGRIDYDVDADGTLRVWEINTNPVLVPSALPPWAARRGVNARGARRVVEALADLDPADGQRLPPGPRLLQVTAMRRSQPWYATCRAEAAGWQAVLVVSREMRRLASRVGASDGLHEDRARPVA